MNYQHPALKTYSDNGMRSAGDWLERGRNIIEGSEARTRVLAGSNEVALYTRDQTQRQLPSARGRNAKVAKIALPSAPAVSVIQ